MVLSLGDGFTSWSDTFAGSSLAEAWSQASWAEDMPSVLSSDLASVDTSIDSGDAVLDVLSIDTAKPYVVEMAIVPWGGSFHGTYRLYLRLDDTTPDITEDGVIVELFMDDEEGTFSGTLTSVDDGDETEYDLGEGAPGTSDQAWFSVVVDGDALTVYWNRTVLLEQVVDTHGGTRVGFGMECVNDGGVCLASVFRVQYYSDAPVSNLRSMLIASADGSLFHESFYGRMEESATSLTLRDDVSLLAAQSGQELYIADYGDVCATGTDGTTNGTAFDAASYADWTALGIDKDDMVVVVSNGTGTTVDGTYGISVLAAGSITLDADAGIGTCAYRIERAPKIYDPSDDTMELMVATTGQVPTGNPLICRYIDRIVLAGAEIAPHVWYMSRQGDPLDWDYSQEDDQRAVAGTASQAGVPGSPITALIPHSDDYLIIACRNELWRLRGDPAFDGSLDSLSRTIGVIGPKAWCLGPSGELVFLSLDGLYAVNPGGDEGATFPVQLSRDTLPQEFMNVNPDFLTILLEYDVQGRGVHIYLTPESSNDRIHWWFDWANKSFWPVTLYSDHEPTATCQLQATAIEDSGVILGGRDGVLRRFSDNASRDCGVEYETFVICGPIGLAPDSFVGTVLSLDAELAEDSGDVAWEIMPGLTFREAVTATPTDSGTWSGGLNARERPACRGQAFSLKLSGIDGLAWAVEGITAIISVAGRRRID